MLTMGFNLLVLYRMVFAVILGFILGLERELTNKHAGLRTHILVCLGSAAFTLLSIYAFPMAVDQSHPQAYGDPARIAAQILTGIGFIGGGTVLRHGSSVFGLTTAATLWVAAAIGMACGSGMVALATIATLLSVGVLVFIRSFERNVLTCSTKSIQKIRLIIHCNKQNAEFIHNYITENFGCVHELIREIDSENENLIKIEAKLDAKNKEQVQTLYKKIQNTDGINSIQIQENNE